MKRVAIAVAMISCAPTLAAAAEDKGSLSVLETSPIDAPWKTADVTATHPALIMPSQAFTMKDLPDFTRELDSRSPMVAPLRVANDDALVRRPNIQDPNLGIKAVDQQLATMGPRQANTFPVMAALSMLGAALKVTGTSGITVNLPPR